MAAALEANIYSPPSGGFFVGGPPAEDFIRQIFQDRVPTFSTNPRVPSDRCWERDYRVVRRTGEHLVPYPLIKSLKPVRRIVDIAFRALLPEESACFLDGRSAGYGSAFDQETVKATHAFATQFGIPSVQAKTVIEGGNCFLLETKTGPAAIVGVHSVVLSLLALEEQVAFPNFILDGAPDPSDVFIRMARNQSLGEEKKKCLEANRGTLPFGTWKEPEYNERLRKPVDPSDRKQYRDGAQLLEKKWDFTCRKMAEELEIERERLTVLHQTRFHIDEVMTVAPDGSVIMRDAKEEDTLMKQSPYCNDFIPPTEEEKKISAVNALTLQDAGFLVFQMPGCYMMRSGSSGSSPVSFFNGLHFEGKCFLTNGGVGSARYFQAAFKQAFETVFPGVDVEFSPDLGQVLSRYGGGLHCLTCECRLPPMMKEVKSIRDDQQPNAS